MILLSEEEVFELVKDFAEDNESVGVYVARSQLKKFMEELEGNGWVLARKKDVSGAWILELVGWDTLSWQSLKEEAGL